MKSKLDLAHEYYISRIKAGDTLVTIKEAWAYVDAMYEQHEKRSPPPKTIADIAKEINQNIKEDGQKIATKQKALLDNARDLTKDENGNCMHFHHEFGHKKCMDCGVSLKEWQPDWSQAPDWAKYWVATANRNGEIGGGWFFECMPGVGTGIGPSVYSGSGKCILTSSFNYSGHWRDSLRKRPK